LCDGISIPLSGLANIIVKTWFNILLSPLPVETDSFNQHVQSLKEKITGMRKRNFWQQVVTLDDERVFSSSFKVAFYISTTWTDRKTSLGMGRDKQAPQYSRGL
jgi:hypothetical protein